MIKITIFTPTYNRKNTLECLYDSLKNQTCYDFEWLIMDDGSTDNTEEYLKSVLNEKKNFDVRYIKTINGGKHRAINRGVQEANGEYFFIVDSDDYLLEDAIENIKLWIKDIEKNEKKFVGVSGLKGYGKNEIVGRTFNKEYLDCTDLERVKFNIYGDKSEVYKTEILKQYKFPEFDNEKFITEAIVWNRIAKDGYYIRHFNKITYICQYREDGLTKKSDELFCDNFKGYTLYVNEILKYSKIKRVKVKAIMAYGYRGNKLSKLKFKELSKNINISITIIWLLTQISILYKKWKR